MNLHFHALLLDGVYARDDKTGKLRFHRAPAIMLAATCLEGHTVTSRAGWERAAGGPLPKAGHEGWVLARAPSSVPADR